MITFMCKIPQICITNRHLVKGDFLKQIRYVAGLQPEKIILREKDLSQEEYVKLAEKVLEICRQMQVPLVLHYYPEAAKILGVQAVHLPLPLLRSLPVQQKRCFEQIGASVHSVEEAIEAEKLGAAYVAAGHVFATDCKKGVPPRGTGFLRQVCESVKIPVYALGGISDENQRACMDNGAAGVCRMSDFMRRFEH